VKPALQIYETPDALAENLAQWLYDKAVGSVGDFSVALSGGSTPRLTYTKLASKAGFPWERTHWFFGDERFVPHDDPRSNYRMARETLLMHAPADRVHPVPTDLSDAVAAAAAYEMHMKAVLGSHPLDVALQGLGTDGHTASLFPGDPALNVSEHWVTAAGLGSNEPRVTLTYPVINQSRTVVFMVAGSDKREMLKRLLIGDKKIPAGALAPTGDFLVFADKAAAAS